MVYIDMSQPDRELTPGIDLWEIMEVKEGTSGKGDKKLEVKFCRVSNISDHIYDTVMLAGGGWGIGKRKLAALVGDGFAGDLDLHDLYGKRLWLSTGRETYKGKDRLKVLIDDLSCAGYQKAEDVPPGCALPAEPDENEVPF